MQTNSRLFDDLARLATGALGTAQGMKAEWENLFHQRMERFIADMDLVPREEFDAVKAMAVLLREENEALVKRIEALEAKIDATPKKAPARKAALKAAKSGSAKSGN
ncbi:MAG: accessory factor UbiK family protein [Alphaproteobacteria bacterium]|nr:MAG: accessory factor UbiK family protein [Alphaproteobacteria bacterium]